MLDLTQQEFGDRIGIKRNTVANYETGRNEPVDSVVSLICREFKINEEWLRDGVGEMFVPESKDKLDKLASDYNLSDAEKILIEKYLNLKSSSRKVIMDFILDVADSLAESERNMDALPPIPDNPEELEKTYVVSEGEDMKGGLG